MDCSGTHRIAGRQALVVGLGVSGAAAARLLCARGAQVSVTDAAASPAAADQIPELTELGVTLDLGSHDPALFAAADLIVVSPGVPETMAPLRRARDRGIPVIGELELAAGFITAPILAVTGTNGKTTTTELLGHILAHAGLRIFVGGNIGRPLSEAAMIPDPPDAVIAEVSSFQLDTTRAFRPRVSVLLNITPDHLDRYPDLDAYAASKGRIFTNQLADDTAVINGSDSLAIQVSAGIRASRWIYDAPDAPTPGAVFDEDALVLQTPAHGRERIDLAGLRLPGRHNRENAAAACLAARAFGLGPGVIESALATFEGLPHRVAAVAEVAGVQFVNDSKATNVDAVARALESFDRPVVLIMGGRDKGGVFETLAPQIRRQARALVLVGEAAGIIDRALGSCVPTRRAADMEDAVATAFSRAQAGDVVLLSPGCASFDMFNSYKHRGRVFCNAVDTLARTAAGRQNG